jgi:hypothetical protein
MVVKSGWLGMHRGHKIDCRSCLSPMYIGQKSVRQWQVHVNPYNLGGSATPRWHTTKGMPWARLQWQLWCRAECCHQHGQGEHDVATAGTGEDVDPLTTMHKGGRGPQLPAVRAGRRGWALMALVERSVLSPLAQQKLEDLGWDRERRLIKKFLHV